MAVHDRFAPRSSVIQTGIHLFIFPILLTLSPVARHSHGHRKYRTHRKAPTTLSTMTNSFFVARHNMSPGRYRSFCTDSALRTSSSFSWLQIEALTPTKRAERSHWVSLSTFRHEPSRSSISSAKVSMSPICPCSTEFRSRSTVCFTLH